MFAVYSYIAPTLTEVAGSRCGVVPVALALFGVGMTGGHHRSAAGWPTARCCRSRSALTASLVVLLLFTVTAARTGPGRRRGVAARARGSTLVPACRRG